MSTIEIRNLSKIYDGGVVAVKNANVRIEDGEFASILGPSGCGKSSTLRSLAGLENITEGEILFDGKVVNNLSSKERNVALAFESYALYSPLTIYENIAFPLRARKANKAEIKQKVMQIAEALEVTDVLDRKPGQLSGGQQQRVSLARALVRNPNVFLLDEPLSHMDQRIRTEVRIQMRRIHEELGNTTIYVTHDQEEAISLCDRILVIYNAELQQIGTVDEIYNKPVNKFVAFFVGQPGMNFIKCKVESPESISLQTSNGKNIFGFTGAVDPKYVGSEITMGIRPQQIGMVGYGGQKSTMSGLVKIVEFQGDSDVLTVELGDINKAKARIKVVIPAGGRKFKQEETCWMDFQPERIHLFDETEKAIIKKMS